MNFAEMVFKDFPASLTPTQNSPTNFSFLKIEAYACVLSLLKALETSRRTMFVECVLLGVGYGFMEDGEGSVCPSTFPGTVMVVVVGVRWWFGGC